MSRPGKTLWAERNTPHPAPTSAPPTGTVTGLAREPQRTVKWSSTGFLRCPLGWIGRGNCPPISWRYDNPFIRNTLPSVFCRVTGSCSLSDWKASRKHQPLSWLTLTVCDVPSRRMYSSSAFPLVPLTMTLSTYAVNRPPSYTSGGCSPASIRMSKKESRLRVPVCRLFGLGTRLLFCWFHGIRRNRPGFTEPFDTGNPTIQNILIHPADRHVPFFSRFLY